MTNSIKLTPKQLERIEFAKQKSLKEKCTLHINTMMVLNDQDELVLFSLSISEMYDTFSTIKTFRNGILM